MGTNIFGIGSNSYGITKRNKLNYKKPNNVNAAAYLADLTKNGSIFNAIKTQNTQHC